MKGYEVLASEVNVRALSTCFAHIDIDVYLACAVLSGCAT